jgi:hypothetical protein
MSVLVMLRIAQVEAVPAGRDLPTQRGGEAPSVHEASLDLSHNARGLKVTVAMPEAIQ